MYQLPKEKARAALMENNFSQREIDRLLANYPPLPDDFAPLVEQWLQDFIIPDFKVDEISIKKVMELRHSHFLVALRDLARLRDETLTPEKREQWRRILTSPVHFE